MIVKKSQIIHNTATGNQLFTNNVSIFTVHSGIFETDEQ